MKPNNIKVNNFKLCIIIIFSILIILSGCDTSISTFKGSALKELEKGSWSWDGDITNCQNAVQKINYQNDDKLVFKWIDLKSDNEDSIHTYLINENHGHYLNLSKVGESEKDKLGKAVTWDLIVKTPFEYCWRRSDWSTLSCTKAMIKCN